MRDKEAGDAHSMTEELISAISYKQENMEKMIEAQRKHMVETLELTEMKKEAGSIKQFIRDDTDREWNKRHEGEFTLQKTYEE